MLNAASAAVLVWTTFCCIVRRTHEQYESMSACHTSKWPGTWQPSSTRASRSMVTVIGMIIGTVIGIVIVRYHRRPCILDRHCARMEAREGFSDTSASVVPTPQTIDEVRPVRRLRREPSTCKKCGATTHIRSTRRRCPMYAPKPQRVEQVHTGKRGKGRPKGSKNIPKKKLGRPVGSKNKSRGGSVEVCVLPPRKRGRPLGSKNDPSGRKKRKRGRPCVPNHVKRNPKPQPGFTMSGKARKVRDDSGPCSKCGGTDHARSSKRKCPKHPKYSDFIQESLRSGEIRGNHSQLDLLYSAPKIDRPRTSSFDRLEPEDFMHILDESDWAEGW